MIPYDSTKEFADTVKKSYLEKSQRRIVSEGLRRIGNHDFYELIIMSPLGSINVLCLKEERGCWAFLLLTLKEISGKLVLERMASTFR